MRRRCKSPFQPQWKVDLKITSDQLEEAITPKSKVLIFSSPNNPCGAIYSKEDLAAIAAVVAKHPNLYIISDEIYELLNYGEVKHVSIASFPEVYNQTITVNGLSKGFAMTGWRVGYIGAPAWIAKACTKFSIKFHLRNKFNCAARMQGSVRG